MDAVFRREILEPLKVRSPQFPANWLGIPYAEIEPAVLEMGRADFSCGYTHPVYGSITAEDKVALYCFMNLRSHFYASLATFNAFRAEIVATHSNAQPTLFVHLGCGPGTSGFAFAEHLSGTGVFDYVPLDLAQPMLDRAASLFAAAKARLVGSGSMGNYLVSENPVHRRVIFNASYLFASDSLNIDRIVQLVRDSSVRCDSVLFIYTNSTDQRANAKWKQFCAALGMADPATQETIQYQNNRFDQNAKTISFMRAVLKVR
jgi:SAM-dependent methyltransferase